MILVIRCGTELRRDLIKLIQFTQNKSGLGQDQNAIPPSIINPFNDRVINHRFHHSHRFNCHIQHHLMEDFVQKFWICIFDYYLETYDSMF